VPALFTSAVTEDCLRELLSAAGYQLSPPRGHGETGVDIKASRGAEELFIEVIGFKSSPPARAKDFYEIFFRAVSRLDHGATKCIIALPARFGAGLPARAKQHGSAWKRIGLAFPELYIWLVNTEARSITEREWNEWLPNPAVQGALRDKAAQRP
jgi:hypothetical protein